MLLVILYSLIPQVSYTVLIVVWLAWARREAVLCVWKKKQIGFGARVTVPGLVSWKGLSVSGDRAEYSIGS